MIIKTKITALNPVVEIAAFAGSAGGDSGGGGGSCEVAVTGGEAAAQALQAAELWRIYWGRHKGRVRFAFHHRGISHKSVVLVTASEGDDAGSSLNAPPSACSSPRRTVGNADFTVTSVAPFDGGVRFAVQIGWDSPLPTWTDVVVMGAAPAGFLRA